MGRTYKISQQEVGFLQRRVLYLRYGTDNPCKEPRPQALLSLNTIARLLKISYT